MSCLFIVLLGGRHKRAKIEVHDIAIAIGENLEETYPQLKNAWFGEQAGFHIDAWAQIHGLEFDGKRYRVQFTHAQPRPNDQKLYLMNLGGYEATEFGEQHRYVLVIAESAELAKQRGKVHFAQHWQKQHVDRVVDVDDCIEIDQVQGRYIELIESDFAQNHWENSYIILS
ncbi:DUF1543 domain-containing protein [Acinetobacter shaoyimingii]|uniref:DUF1543 domain-containing protein n=1 Tax=Acinetobacter shaoyimingii TaxID=2715164 RepID=A0A6G8RY93_9GAMM|nr:DUF1543 domain-containing protein [Acinetobacter shaoyimingii]QIO06820.1 DUF1543 domain-containing protein [Acinetobacter shaoyimingii]